MAIKLTKYFVLKHLDSWKTVGEILSESGNGGDEKAEAHLEKMLKGFEDEGRVFSFQRGRGGNVFSPSRTGNPSYILTRKLSKEQRDRYKNHTYTEEAA